MVWPLVRPYLFELLLSSRARRFRNRSLKNFAFRLLAIGVTEPPPLVDSSSGNEDETERVRRLRVDTLRVAREFRRAARLGGQERIEEETATTRRRFTIMTSTTPHPQMASRPALAWITDVVQVNDTEHHAAFERG